VGIRRIAVLFGGQPGQKLVTPHLNNNNKKLVWSHTCDTSYTGSLSKRTVVQAKKCEK
jgi:hypothetical protein